MASSIRIVGARQNNLQGFDLEIPHHQITCVTGVSGSGKSSLVFDILCREAQRRYFESLSTYARRLFGSISAPAVDSVEGLMPAIAVDQRTTVRSSRSTVGTLSELYDLLRLLFARLGEPDGSFTDLHIERRLFSFNAPEGACETCRGLGVEDRIDPALLIADPAKTLRQGALRITQPNGYTIYSQVTIDVLDQVCRSEGFDVDTPWRQLTPAQQDVVLTGSNAIRIPYGKHTLASRMRWSGITAKPRQEGFYKGILPVMEGILRTSRNANILRFARSVPCHACTGTRLNPRALSVTLWGQTIAAMAHNSIEALAAQANAWHFEPAQAPVGEPLRHQLLQRCQALVDLGLGYLELERGAASLSGGEAQRIRLATQIGGGLRGVLYVLDEPSVGLHPTDHQRMLRLMRRLRDQGNTVVVVEHDVETMRQADRLVDIGPDAGHLGGRLLLDVSRQELPSCKAPSSHTLQVLRTPAGPMPSGHRPSPNDTWLQLRGVRHHNLRDLDVRFLVRGLNVVSGVSGAGKSSLVLDVLATAARGEAANERWRASSGLNDIAMVVQVDQSPIGRNPRSNPATYTKVFDAIRKLFAQTDAARAQGWDEGRFSFNVAGGRCESCEGSGVRQTGLHFLGQVESVCEHCGGRRFNPPTLAVHWRDRNIFDVLQMEVSQAADFFADVPRIHRVLTTLASLGLGYLALGQPATTLSGGEAQRVKLATELARWPKGHTLYVLDEPTTGLHDHDVAVLLQALGVLVERGNTVVVIEHHLQVLTAADYVLDLGPGGGAAGGRLVYEGPPAGLVHCAKSRTGAALAHHLHWKSSRAETAAEAAPDPAPDTAADATPDTATKTSGGAPSDATPSSVQTSSATTRQDTITAPIRLRGVSTHNLKHIDVDIPRGALTVLTGVSGSGKSSLAMDSLFAAAQQAFIGGFSTYARQNMQSMPRPQLASALGLTPAIAIGRGATTSHPRSTVGTLTGLDALYRLLFSRVGRDAAGQHPALLSSAFSFNHESGACPDCGGLGSRPTCDPNALITDPTRPLAAGAMATSKLGRQLGDPRGQYMATLRAVGERHGIDFDQPWAALSAAAKRLALEGSGPETYRVQWHFERGKRRGEHQFEGPWAGLVALVDDAYARQHAQKRGAELHRLMRQSPCSTCGGHRLRPERLAIGLAGYNIADVAALPAGQLTNWCHTLPTALAAADRPVAEALVPAINRRAAALVKLGLSYLSADRPSASLSSGEARRLRLAAQLGSELTGITYMLDEPTVGLHPRDTAGLIDVLCELRDQGNTVVVVEHDADIINAADHLIELGPGAGAEGGHIVFAGSPAEQVADAVAPQPRLPHTQSPALHIVGARAHNLRNIDVTLPTGCLTVLAGVSGSGKTSLAFDVLAASASRGQPVACTRVEGLDAFAQVTVVDAAPIGTTPQSTPASYTGILDRLRQRFAASPEARAAGLSKSHFAYASKAGRCERCQGSGALHVAMDFLADVWSPCPACQGQRYNPATLACRVDGANIADWLAATVTQVAERSADDPALAASLTLLAEVGLGHLRLGQSATSLSAGEAQRLRLARELLQERPGPSLYILDEPTTGLHRRDVRRLLALLSRLLAEGHSLLVVEHHPDVIAAAHHVVELGPGAGEAGGTVVFAGSSTALAGCDSPTGVALRRVAERADRSPTQK